MDIMMTDTTAAEAIGMTITETEDAIKKDTP